MTGDLASGTGSGLALLIDGGVGRVVRNERLDPFVGLRRDDAAEVVARVSDVARTEHARTFRDRLGDHAVGVVVRVGHDRPVRISARGAIAVVVVRIRPRGAVGPLLRDQMPFGLIRIRRLVVVCVPYGREAIRVVVLVLRDAAFGIDLLHLIAAQVVFEPAGMAFVIGLIGAVSADIVAIARDQRLQRIAGV